MKKLIVCFWVFLAIKTQAQIITTVVGNGIAGYLGDGGQATNAEINNINALYADPTGIMYISDAFNHVIRTVKDGGLISTIAGKGIAGFSGDGGHATAAQLNNPAGVVADPAGNVYIGDYYNHCIRKVSMPSGIISTIAGTPGVSGYGGDGGPATNAHFNRAYAVSLDGFGNLYCADQYNHRIRKINLSTGIITTVAGTGTPGTIGDGGQATDAEIFYPNYVHSDAAGNLYITDNGNHKIRKVNTSGIITTIAGNGIGGFSGDGGPATNAQLKFPGGVNVDLAGNLYIADGYNYLVRKVNTAGVISTIAGIPTVSGYSGDNGPATAAKLNVPIDIGVDSYADVYIADNLNSRVRKITCIAPSVSAIVGPAIDTLCIDSMITLTDTVGGGVWSSTDTTATISSSGTVTGVAVGYDTLLYTVSNSCTTATAKFPIYVKNCLPISVKPINSRVQDKIIISPNPNKGTFAIELQGIGIEHNLGTLTINISDIYGRVIETKKATTVNSTKINLETESISAGTYFITISYNGNIYREKFNVIK